MAEDGEGESDEKGFQYINSLGIYQVGQNIQYLNLHGGIQYPVKTHPSTGNDGILGTLEQTKNILQLFDNDLRIIRDLNGMVAKLSEEYEEPAQGEAPPELSDEHSDELRAIANTWDNIIREELESMYRYPPQPSPILRIEELIDNPVKLFGGEKEENQLPDQVIEDMTQAIHSLAFGAPTGSVFLSLRAVEDRLRAWYEHDTGRDIERRNFGEVIGEIDDQYAEDEKPDILHHLNYLKAMRNEVAHPDHSPTRREAESTLVNVRETILKIEERLSESESSNTS